MLVILKNELRSTDSHEIAQFAILQSPSPVSSQYPSHEVAQVYRLFFFFSSARRARTQASKPPQKIKQWRKR
jgi:hypothetical protein